MRRKHARYAQTAIEGKLPPMFDFRTRGLALGIARDGSNETAIEAILKLPIGQAEKILPELDRSTRGEARLLSACALAMWSVARRCDPKSGAVEIVEGVCERAFTFALLKAIAEPYSHSAIWGADGPMRRLKRLGVFHRHQPPAGTTPHDGYRRCSVCRRPLEHAELACPAHPSAAPMQWAVAQVRYARHLCGRSPLTLARKGKGPVRELAIDLIRRYAPWLIAGASQEAAEVAAQAEQRPDARALPASTSTSELAPAAAAAPSPPPPE